MSQAHSGRGIMSRFVTGELAAGYCNEVISSGEKGASSTPGNGVQLPQMAGNLALAFGDILRSVAHHLSGLEHQLINRDMDMDHIKGIQGDCARGANLAYQLMLFSGKIRVKSEQIDLNDVMRSIDPIISRTVRSGINTEVDIADQALPIMGDAMLLKQVLANLLANANDAMPSGGTIAVATRKVHSKRWFPEITRENLISGCALLSVVNSKPGIEDSILPRIFEPFFTTKPKSIGLGLPVAQAIVRAHHGCLSIVSKIDVGTLVHLYLPLVTHKH